MTTTITADLAHDVVGGRRPARAPGGERRRHHVDRHRRVDRRHGSAGVPNYVARRIAFAVAALTAMAVLAAAVVVVAATLAGFGGAPAVASGAQPAPPASAVHVATAGDTLWSIAAEHRGDVEHRSYLEVLIDLNGGTAIEVGQAVRLP